MYVDWEPVPRHEATAAVTCGFAVSELPVEVTLPRWTDCHRLEPVVVDTPSVCRVMDTSTDTRGGGSSAAVTIVCLQAGECKLYQPAFRATPDPLKCATGTVQNVQSFLPRGFLDRSAFENDDTASMSAPARSLAGGHCTFEDGVAIHKAGNGHAKGTFPEISATCGLQSFSLLYGYEPEYFMSCFQGKLDVSTDCAECFSNDAVFAVAECKMPCLFGWCSQMCLDCVAKNHAARAACTGIVLPTPTAC